MSPSDPTPPSLTTEAAARHRSSAVARMLKMPVATLRIWERRYAVTQPELSASGQRLYSAADVRRLALLKQLTDLGHAIGTLAALDMEQLQQVASTHAGARPVSAAESPPPHEAVGSSPWRVAVLGEALAERVGRAAVLRQLARPVQLLGPFEDAAQAGAVLQGVRVDALLIQAPRLHEGWLDALRTEAPALADLPLAVLFRFAAEPTCTALAASGVRLMRDPQGDAVLGQWLQSLMQPRVGPAAAPRALAPASAEPPARRWDDAVLAAFAEQSSTMACECPRHVTELLLQLSHFEAYSAECRHRNAADAELHAQLQQVAARARLHFEQALEQVALHEGLLLPPCRATPASLERTP